MKDTVIKGMMWEFNMEGVYQMLSPVQRLMLWPPCYGLDAIGAKALALGLIRGATFIYAIKDY